MWLSQLSHRLSPDNTVSSDDVEQLQHSIVGHSSYRALMPQYDTATQIEIFSEYFKLHWASHCSPNSTLFNKLRFFLIRHRRQQHPCSSFLTHGHDTCKHPGPIGSTLLLSVAQTLHIDCACQKRQQRFSLQYSWSPRPICTHPAMERSTLRVPGSRTFSNMGPFCAVWSRAKPRLS